MPRTVEELKNEDLDYVTAERGKVQHENTPTSSNLWFFMEIANGKGIQYALPREVYERTSQATKVTLWYSGPRTVDNVRGNIRGIGVDNEVIEYATDTEHKINQQRQRREWRREDVAQFLEEATRYQDGADGTRQQTEALHDSLHPTFMQAIDGRLEKFKEPYALSGLANDVKVAAMASTLVRVVEQQLDKSGMPFTFFQKSRISNTIESLFRCPPARLATQIGEPFDGCWESADNKLWAFRFAKTALLTPDKLIESFREPIIPDFKDPDVADIVQNSQFDRWTLDL